MDIVAFLGLLGDIGYIIHFWYSINIYEAMIFSGITMLLKLIFKDFTPFGDYFEECWDFFYYLINPQLSKRKALQLNSQFEQNDCVIRLYEFNPIHQQSLIHCGHTIHKKCLIEYESHQPPSEYYCPICKQRYTKFSKWHIN